MKCANNSIPPFSKIKQLVITESYLNFFFIKIKNNVISTVTFQISNISGFYLIVLNRIQSELESPGKQFLLEFFILFIY